jgi:hypothetical protein
MMAEDQAIKPEPKYKIKAITKRASQSARKYIRRTKQAARNNGPLPR